MDLGKSMERMLTLDDRTFTRLLLHRKVTHQSRTLSSIPALCTLHLTPKSQTLNPYRL